MRYYVLATDGQKYGPADVPTLQEWANERRLLPDTMLEAEGSGAQIAAGAVPGLTFAAPAEPAPPVALPTPPAPGLGVPGPYTQAPGPVSNYPRGPQAGSFTTPTYGQPQYSFQDNGKKDMILAFVMVPVSIVISLFIGLGGIITAMFGVRMAQQAMNKGQSVAVVALVLNVLAVIFRFAIIFMR